MGITSYAQNFEDVMLWRALAHVERGFYIDVGAQDPVADSVSLAFYERGWRGIHVEPVPKYAELLRQQRPGDLVIQSVIGDGPAVLTFFEVPETGLSTADKDIATSHAERGFEVRETSVPCIPLSSVFDLVEVNSDVHWLKIDVEGLERDVLRSWGASSTRPWIVVVESTIPMTDIEAHEGWEPLLLVLGYEFAYFDGLNRFYVSEAHPELKRLLSIPPNVFDGFEFGVAGAAAHRLIRSRFEENEAQLRSQIAQQMEANANEAALRAERERALIQQVADGQADAAKLEQRLLSENRELQSSALSREREFTERLRQIQQEYSAQLAKHLQLIDESRQREDAVRQSALSVRDEMLRQADEQRTRLDEANEALTDARHELEELQNSMLWRLFGRWTHRQTTLRRSFVQTTSVSTGYSNRSPEGSGTLSELNMPESYTLEPAASVDELLAMQDAQFVACAYISILGRPVDPDGLRTYLGHVRGGADKAELVLEIAASPEAQDSPSIKLAGLDLLAQRTRRNRPSFFSRLISSLIKSSLMPLQRQIDVCDYRITELEESLESRLGRLENAIASRRNGSTETLPHSGSDDSEHAQLQRMSLHARSIYFRLQDAAREHLRTAIA
jgi:FkbM family methyltransferase